MKHIGPKGHRASVDTPDCRRYSSLLGPVLLALVICGCDTFFELDLVITDCVTGQPLPGVAASTHLENSSSKEDHNGTTDVGGKVFIHLNAPDGSTVTLSLAKVGYQDWTKQFQGEPEQPYTVCLQPL